jgi:hypothetical protein
MIMQSLMEEGKKLGTQVILHFETKKENPKLICCTLIKMRTMTF